MKYPFVVLNVLLTSFMFAGCWHDINCLPDSHFTDEGKIKSEYLPDSSLEKELAENVKFFIEASGSMNGLYRPQCSTEFRDDVYQIVCYYTRASEKVYTLCQNNGKSGYELSLEDFANAIKNQGFSSMNATSITDMIETVVSQIDTSRNEVGVLVTDMKFDPTGNDDIEYQLGMYTTKVSHITSTTGMAFCLVGATSKYYDRNGMVIANKSPYYYLIIGKSSNVASIRDGISTMLNNNGNYVGNIETGMRYGGPNFILKKERNCLMPDANNPAFLDYDDGSPCYVSLNLELNKYRWCVAEPDNVKKALEMKMLHGGRIDIDSIVIDSVFIDEERRLNRSMQAKVCVKIDKLPNDIDVIEWSFDPCKLSSDAKEFMIFYGANDWRDFDKTFSLENFIAGMFRGANLSMCSKKKNYILISKHS